ncbi:MAG: hypothetical protein E6H73_13495 [Betaproteobacteria bacterium]|nr:MAG: hypothetical protein E6H73_13495 [Betaproteobacteria bacterium]
MVTRVRLSKIAVSSRSQLRRVPIAGLLCLLVTAGCGGVKQSPPGAQPQNTPPAATAEAAPPMAPSASSPRPRTAAVAAPSGTAASEATNPAVASPVIVSQNAGKSVSPAAKASTAAVKTPVAQPGKKESIAPEVAKKSSPTLDLTSLEQRLKDTDAIGVLTKIALKNQVDDLLDRFRAYYQGKLKTTLAELRRPYDLLVLKVLSLLQDSDPSLASAIVASREAIWGILADRAKFATVS